MLPPHRANNSAAIEADRQSATYLSNRAAAFMAANQYVLALEDCKQAEESVSCSTHVIPASHRTAKLNYTKHKGKEGYAGLSMGILH